MFEGCLSLKELNLSNFNIYNVHNKTEMFNGCNSLVKSNVYNNQKLVANMHYAYNRYHF